MKKEIGNWMRNHLGENTASRIKGTIKAVMDIVWDAEARAMTPLRLKTNAHRKDRRLEIGPGEARISGFETLSVRGGKHVDYVIDAKKRLPFADNTFSTVYASHVLEHIPWYLVDQAVIEWYRVIDIGGSLELFVPDGLKICKAFVDAEYHGSIEFQQDGWFRFNPHKDPCLWANGRIFSYGDGKGQKLSPNWHMALFSERYILEVLKKAGFTHVEKLPSSAVRGHDHGWINIGFIAQKLSKFNSNS